MDGGVLSVPFDKLNDFYEKYIECIKKGEKLFVVEQKTPTYNFFIDIDYKSEDSLSIDEIKSICKVICDKVKRHGGKKCIISVAPPKSCGTLVKSGVHLNWPGFVVDKASANALREHVLIALSKAKGRMDWNEIVDSSVYGDPRRSAKGSGLRMPWSYKKEKHNVCNGRGCIECGGKKVDQVAYLPVFMYTPEPLSTIIRIDQKPDVEILKMSAVRTDAPQNAFIQPPSTPIREGTFTDEETKDEIQDEELRTLVESFVRKNIEGQSGAYITKLFKHKTMFLLSTTSNYCENLKRAHNSNHVWFIISGKLILQKCFCKCETLRGRRDGFCKDFCGRRHELPSPIIDRLYPKKEELKKCPEIKKPVEKPKFNQQETKPLLERFLDKFVPGQSGTSIVNIKRNKTTCVALTTSSYCESIRGEHSDSVMSYIIKGNKLTQQCPLCKGKKNKARTYVIIDNTLIKLLKQ
tara:strand:+ start:2208 stop:3602 length:1395 start_codon:yes stop_codon:yes gene_type:complete